MKIGVNTRLLLKGKLTGIGWFTYQTLRYITNAHPEHTFYFFFDRPYNEEFVFSSNVVPVVLGPKARHPILFRIWMDIRVLRKARQLGIEAFISPEGMLPLKLHAPCLTVIHDLNFEHYPNDLAKSHSRYYRKYFPLFCRKAARIATVSEYSKQDICKQYDINPSKIDVVYNGVNEWFAPLDESKKGEVRNRLTEGHPYFIFVGMLHPRKNVHRLFDAFDRFKSEVLSDVKLLIVGEKLWWDGEISEAYERMAHQQDVVFTGHLPSQELVEAMGASLALTYVPYFEGFGIPILEGFKCGVPVITSNRTSMPEVAGDGAILVDPFSVQAIEWAMRQMVTNSDLRDQLVANGFERLKHFSWEQSAELLWGSFEKMMGERP
ncbi:MAG: glycosyltransferase family 4 protein [Flavobacteriales bacterium]|nr:glycosyltransferase family 4 protein [Flavobacteriales bacterium]